MSAVGDLHDLLHKGFKIERRPDQPEVTDKVVEGVRVVDVLGYPQAPTLEHRADVHFVLIAPTEGMPERGEFIAAVVAATGGGVFQALTVDDLAHGPSYITLGGWLGSQDLALMLIGAAALLDIAPAIIPATLGVTDQALADQMAGGGMVMLGPSRVWVDG